MCAKGSREVCDNSHRKVNKMNITEPQARRLAKIASRMDGAFTTSRGGVANVCRRLVKAGMLEQTEYKVGIYRETWTFRITDAGRKAASTLTAA
jgi:hypothetical protein